MCVCALAMCPCSCLFVPHSLCLDRQNFIPMILSVLTNSYTINPLCFIHMLWPLSEYTLKRYYKAIRTLYWYCMPDEARDGRNVALKFSSDCARLSKAEFLHQNFSMPNIFHDKAIRSRQLSLH